MQLNRILTRIQFVIRYTLAITLLLAIPTLVTFYIGWVHDDLRAAVRSFQGNPVAWHFDPRRPAGNRLHILGRTPREILDAAKRPFIVTLTLLGICALAAFLTTLLLTLLLKPDEKIKRGTHILSPGQFHRWLRREAKRPGSPLRNRAPGVPRKLQHRFAIGPVPFPVNFENVSILAFGSPGSGKSVLLNQIMKGSTIAVPGLFGIRRNIQLPGIFDQGGFCYDRADLTQIHLRMREEVHGQTAPPHAPSATPPGVYPFFDYLLDPYDARSLHVNLFDEITSTTKLDAFCAGFFPKDETSNEAFWQGVSQQLLSASMKLCIAQAREAGAKPNMEMYAELLRAITEDIDTFRVSLTQYPDTAATVAALLGPVGQPMEKTTQSAFTTFQQEARVFMDPVWRQSHRPTLSLTKFLQLLKAPNIPVKPWLFIRNRPQHQASYQKIYTALFNMVFTDIISQPAPSAWPRIQVLIDEWPSLQRLSMMQPLLAEGRKFGIFTVAMAQSPKQLELIYKREGAASLFATFATRIVFRQADAESAKALSDLAGEREQVTHSTTTQLNEHQLQGSLSTSESLQVRKALLPSEIMGIQDFHFVACFPNTPWFHGELPKQFHSARKDLEPFSPANLHDEIFNPATP